MLSLKQLTEIQTRKMFEDNSKTTTKDCSIRATEDKSNVLRNQNCDKVLTVKSK